MGFAGLLALIVEVGNRCEHASQDFHLLVLRNESIFLVKALILHGLEGGEGLVEGTVIGGLIAQQDGESGGKFAGGGCGQRFALEMECAVFEPVVLDEVGDEQGFGGVAGLVLVEEGDFKGVELFGILARDEDCAGG